MDIKEFENWKNNLFHLFTSQWFDGCIYNGHDTYGLRPLKRNLKQFDYYGGCWEEVIIKFGETEIFHWERDRNIEFYQDIENLKKKLTEFINTL